MTHTHTKVIKSSHPLMKKFDTPNLGIKEYDHWVLALRAKQITLGSCVILLNRECAFMSDLTDSELIEFKSVSKDWEIAVRHLVRPDKFNYIAAMMKDPFVHFHAIPRYCEPREFNGQTFNDTSWPSLITFENISTPESTLQSIRNLFNDVSI